MLTQVQVRELETVLEEWVDKSSLSKVLEVLSTVCQAKSEHLEANWQDTTTAKYWYQAGYALEKLQPRIEV